MPWTVWAGVALVLLLLSDVLLTVLHPQAHGGPVNRIVLRGVWGAFRLVARPLGPAIRDRWLSFGAPVLSATTIIAWAVLLITGFALIYGAYPREFTHTEWGAGIGWGDAFYFSGIAASTLGLGDVLVEPGPLRVLTVVEALLGFSLISLSAAYILAIYGARSDASALALSVWGAIGDDVERGVRRLAADLDSAEHWAEGTARTLAQVTTEHTQYPILHYFRAPDSRQAMIPQVGALLRLFEVLGERPGWEQRHPSLVMLRNTLDRYLWEVGRRFARHSGIETGQGDAGELDERYRQARRHLLYDDPSRS